MIFTNWFSPVVWLSLLPLGLLLVGYALWMMSGFRRILYAENGSYNGGLSQPPLFSVIIAAHNEADHLPATLRALTEIDFPSERVEYILVNDRSTDTTLQLMQKEAQVHSNWHVISSTPSSDLRGKVNALRCGTDMAAGDYFIFLDADCVPAGDWLQAYDSLVLQYDVICGHIWSPSDNRGIWYRLLNLEHLFSSLQVMAGSGHGRPLFSRGGNWGYSRELWIKCGRWNALKGKSWGDDILMMDQFRKQPDLRFGYALQATVATPAPQSYSHWLRSSLRCYGKINQLTKNSIVTHILFYLLVLLPLVTPLLMPQLLLPWLAGSSLIVLAFMLVIHRGAFLLQHQLQPATVLLFLILLPPWVLLQSIAGTILNSSAAFRNVSQEDQL